MDLGRLAERSLIVIQMDKGVIQSRYVLVGRRLYHVFVVFKLGCPNPSAARHFFDSVRLQAE